MLRIYVGGLGLNVREDDLRKTFGSPQLGSVESVEIIRTKGRSFAYLDFVPTSDKGLAKLFSTYNGCMWKGGRLKLEKAKEHYLSRLQHEWEEDAKLTSKLSTQNDVADETISLKPKSDQDTDKVNLNIFFPKLRKIKPLPLKGSGKHKYSFQRVEIPPLPIHFCDCEEHSEHHGPVIRTRNSGRDNDAETYEVKEEEINMMRSILDKILENENPSKAVPNGDELVEDEETNNNATPVDPWQLEDVAEDQASDEDNLVINIVGHPAKKEDSLSRAVELLSKPVQEIHGNQEKKVLPDKKRKQSDMANNANDTMPSKRKSKNSGKSTNNQVDENKKPMGIVESVDGFGRSKNPSWRDLVKEKENSTFHISDILSKTNSQAKESDHSDTDSFKGEDTSKDTPSHKSHDLQHAKTSASTSTDDKYARGTAWLQKSSWLQLIADANKSAFSIAQVLPGATFEKQEFQQFQESKKQRPEIVLSNSPKPYTGDIINKPHDVDALTKEPSGVSLEPQQPNVESKLAAEKNKENEATDLIIPQSNVLPKDDEASVRRGIVISETCPFMRNAASMREWAKTKAALSGSNKNKGKGKE